MNRCVDLPAALNRVVRTLQRTPNGGRLDWHLDGPEASPVLMLSEDLTELLGNVLENAANWAKSRVSVRVSVGDPVVVRVEDDGPGVPEEALQALAQRGLRLDERTQGFGLGLTIAQDICDAYGAELTFGTADPGDVPVQASVAGGPEQGPRGGLGGLVVTLRIPSGAAIR
jgi:signal transduction histidine kinase